LNTLRRPYEVGVGLTQNGIAFSSRAKGTAGFNKVQGGYTDVKEINPNGIHIFEASNLTVASNSISGVREGI